MTDAEFQRFLATNEAEALRIFRERAKYSATTREGWETRRRAGTAPPDKGTTAAVERKYRMGARSVTRWRPRNRRLRDQKKVW
jgi:hypothetical protein